MRIIPLQYQLPLHLLSTPPHNLYLLINLIKRSCTYTQKDAQVMSTQKVVPNQSNPKAPITLLAPLTTLQSLSLFSPICIPFTIPQPLLIVVPKTTHYLNSDPTKQLSFDKIRTRYTFLLNLHLSISSTIRVNFLPRSTSISSITINLDTIRNLRKPQETSNKLLYGEGLPLAQARNTNSTKPLATRSEEMVLVLK